MSQSSQLYMNVGRTLLGLYFLIPGIMKIVAWKMHIDMVQSQGIPFESVMLAVATAAEIIGGLLLITNRYVHFASLGFVVLILIINFALHGFWEMDEATAPHEAQNFIKNLAILAGLLVLAAASPKRKLSIKGLAKSDSKAD